jgi:hypothetical protein
MKTIKTNDLIINEILNIIYVKSTEFTDSNNNIKDLSIYTGLAGINLFQIYYDRFKNGFSSAKNLAEEKIEILLSFFEKYKDSYKGDRVIFQFSELALFFTALEELNLISKKDLLNFIDEESDQYIFEASKFYLKNGLLDYLDGAINLGYYLFKRINYMTDKGYILTYINEFIKNISNTKIIPPKPYQGIYWRSFGVYDKSWGINIGMAHGIPAILMLLVKFYPYLQPKQKSEVLQLIKEGLLFIESVRLSPDAKSSFPAYIEIDFSKVRPEHSFLAWCYGDLSIAKLYKEASKISSFLKIYDKYSCEIVKKAFERDLSDEICIKDNINLCHGAAGVLMMYNSLVSDPSIIIRGRQEQFWLNNLIEQLTILKNTDIDCDKLNFSFLEGLSGVGLALLNILDKQSKKWQELLFFDI